MMIETPCRDEVVRTEPGPARRARSHFRKARSSPSPGPAAAASRRCCTVMAGILRPDAGEVRYRGARIDDLERGPALPAAAHRVRGAVPVRPARRGTPRGGERRAAAAARRNTGGGRRRTAGGRRGWTGSVSASWPSSCRGDVRRPAAARGARPRPGDRPEGALRRRAHRCAGHASPGSMVHGPHGPRGPHPGHRRHAGHPRRDGRRLRGSRDPRCATACWTATTAPVGSALGTLRSRGGDRPVNLLTTLRLSVAGSRSDHVRIVSDRAQRGARHGVAALRRHGRSRCTPARGGALHQRPAQRERAASGCRARDGAADRTGPHPGRAVQPARRARARAPAGRDPDGRCDTTPDHPHRGGGDGTRVRPRSGGGLRGVPPRPRPARRPRRAGPSPPAHGRAAPRRRHGRHRSGRAAGRRRTDRTHPAQGRSHPPRRGPQDPAQPSPASRPACSS